LDFLIVARIASWFVNKYNIQKYTPFIRVALMAGILTFVAPIIESRNIVSLQSYLIALPRNYIFALVLQVFIAIKL
jgi:hypothetical protein